MTTGRVLSKGRERQRRWERLNRDKLRDRAQAKRDAARAARMAQRLGRPVSLAEAIAARAGWCGAQRTRHKAHRAMLTIEQGGACACCAAPLARHATLDAARDAMLCAGCATVARIMRSARGAAVARYLAGDVK